MAQLTASEYQEVVNATSNLTASKIQQAMATAAAGTGDVTGAASSTDNAITRWDGATGKIIQDSLITISDTGDMEGVTSILGKLNTQLIIGDDNSGGVKILASGDATVQSALNVNLTASGDIIATGATFDVSGMGQVVLGAGAVGAPSLTFTGNLTDGYYSVSGTQLGTSINGALVGGWDANGLFTGTISEQVGAAGVTFPNDIHANSIKDNGANITIDQTFSTGRIILTTFDNTISLTSGAALDLETSSNGDLNLVVHGTGVLTMNGADTFTGTVAAAAALNIVNGLVIA